MVYYHSEMEKPETLICTMKDCTEPRADQAPDATNRHCRTHRNEAQKKYVMAKTEQEYARAFLAGVTATKDLLATEFHHAIRGAMISGTEAARLVRACRGPFPPSATSPAAS